jgi:hypothetical protein
MARPRALYVGLLLMTIAAGLASRRFPDLQPGWMASYAGDALWAAMVFWLLALVARRAPTMVIGAAALGIAWGVEGSQLIHVPWLDSLRSSRLGALVLGQGFLWSDLVCHAVGVGVAGVIDVRAARR